MKIVSKGTKPAWWDGLVLECWSCHAELELEHGDMRFAIYHEGDMPTEPEHWEVDCPVCGMDIPFTKQMAAMQGGSV